DDGILDQWIGLQGIFNIFRIDIEAVGQDDKIFLPSLQIQIALSIHLPEVTCVIPAILKNSRCGLGIFPIAASNIGAAHQYFLIVGDTHLYPRQRLTDGAKRMFMVRCDRDHGSAFSSSVTLHDPKAHILPFFGKGWWQIRSTTDKETKMPTKAFMDRSEEQTSPAKRQVGGNLEQLLELFLFLLTTHLALNTIEEQLQSLRYQHYTRHLL